MRATAAETTDAVFMQRGNRGVRGIKGDKTRLQDLRTESGGGLPGKSSTIRGGGGGIRTRDTVSRIHTFQACAFDRSATPPGLRPGATLPAARRTIVGSAGC